MVILHEYLVHIYLPITLHGCTIPTTYLSAHISTCIYTNMHTYMHIYLSAYILHVPRLSCRRQIDPPEQHGDDDGAPELRENEEQGESPARRSRTGGRQF